MAVVIGIGVLVLAGTAAVLVSLYPQPLIEYYAARSLDRRLSFGSLKLGWGNPVTIEARDIRLSNASWAPEPDMFRADYLSGAVDTDALWRGVLRFRRLRVEKPVVLLERGPDNARNWRFPGSGGSAKGGFAVVPKNRTQFPILLNFVMRNGAVILRSPDRHDIRVDFYDFGIRAPADDKPAQLTVDGAYNGAALRLNADTESFVQLRDGTTPFGVSVSIAAAPGSIDFKGTLQEPVDFDGARGTLEVDAQNIGDLLKIFGAGLQAAFPLRLAGPFEKTGDHWQITHGDGHLPAGNFNGDVTLDEGARGQPDGVGLNLAFDRLDVSTLLAGNQGSGKPMSLQPDPSPGALFDATVAAQSLVYNQLRLNDVKAHGRTRPGDITVDAVTFNFAGGTVEADASAHGTETGGAVALKATAAALDAGQLVAMLGGDKGELSGKLDARVGLDMQGETAADGLKHSHAQAALAMVEGRVSRDLIERASTNLLTLFRAGEGDAPLSCLVGVAEMKDGVVEVGPLRLRTPTTTFVAGGQADLITDRVDLNIRSSGGGLFALKLPLQIAGSFQKLNAKPLLGSAPPIRETPDHDLPPGMRGLIEHNPCLR
ncbi:MAG: AsmA family protein [Alphaproteobacteria bacterium]|nr:AsmA family protein [Alphaproteobacteria bacterium]